MYMISITVYIHHIHQDNNLLAGKERNTKAEQEEHNNYRLEKYNNYQREKCNGLTCCWTYLFTGVYRDQLAQMLKFLK
jgi:hypothetical protein